MSTTYKPVDNNVAQPIIPAQTEERDIVGKDFATTVTSQKIVLAASSTHPKTVDKKPPEKPVSVNIAAYRETPKEGHKYNESGTFDGRSKGIKADHRYAAHTGKQIVDDLVDASKHGPIKKLVILSHGSGSALYMNPDEGLYGDSFDKFVNTGSSGPNAAILDDIKKRIDSGEIKFAKDAKIILLGCSTAKYPGMSWVWDSFAENFSEIVPDAEVVGATAKSKPDEVDAGGRRIDSNDYRANDGEWHVFKNGEKINTIQNPFNPDKY